MCFLSSACRDDPSAIHYGSVAHVSPIILINVLDGISSYVRYFFDLDLLHKVFQTRITGQKRRVSRPKAPKYLEDSSICKLGFNCQIAESGPSTASHDAGASDIHDDETCDGYSGESCSRPCIVSMPSYSFPALSHADAMSFRTLGAFQGAIDLSARSTTSFALY
jgi:hypothetical protein